MKSSKEWIKNLFDLKPPRRLLFRVDAARIPGLSFGHLARCLILSKIIRETYRSENLFLMRNHPEGINHASRSGEQVTIIPKETPFLEERRYVLDAFYEFNPDCMVIDLPYTDLDMSYYPILRNHGAKLLFVDDFRFTDPGVDVLLNTSVLAPAKTKIQPDGKTTYLLGPEYLIFDEELKKETPVRKEGLTNVALTFGGSDPTGLTPKVLEALLTEQWPQIFFRVFLGPGYSDCQSIEDLLGNRGQQFGIERNAQSIIPFLRGCDFAVCAGGRTMYELLYLNKKFLPIATSDLEG
jgi:spore coat polysaccharide biosynthesis predicted glycosyltransferase SpsG